MADVVDLATVRRHRLGMPKATLDPETAEVFPGVSLADLWRVWAHYHTPPEGSGAAIFHTTPRTGAPGHRLTAVLDDGPRSER